MCPWLCAQLYMLVSGCSTFLTCTQTVSLLHRTPPNPVDSFFFSHVIYKFLINALAGIVLPRINTRAPTFPPFFLCAAQKAPKGNLATCSPADICFLKAKMWCQLAPAPELEYLAESYWSQIARRVDRGRQGGLFNGWRHFSWPAIRLPTTRQYRA